MDQRDQTQLVILLLMVRVTRLPLLVLILLQLLPQPLLDMLIYELGVLFRELQIKRAEQLAEHVPVPGLRHEYDPLLDPLLQGELQFGFSVLGGHEVSNVHVGVLGCWFEPGVGKELDHLGAPEFVFF